MYSQITTYDRQTAFDIALQEWGSIEGVFELLVANPGLSLDSNIPAGTVLRIEGTVISQPVVDFYKKNDIKPATGNVEGQSVYSKETNKKVEM